MISYNHSSLPAKWSVTPYLERYFNQLYRICKQKKADDPLYHVAFLVLSKKPISLNHLRQLPGTNKPLQTDTIELDAFVGGGLYLSHLAAFMGDIALAKHLHQLGLFENTSSQGGITPCHLAALKGHVHFLQQAAPLGCNLMQHTTTGYTPVTMLEIVYPHLASYCPFHTRPRSIPVMTADKHIQKKPLKEAEDHYHFTYTDYVCKNAATMESIIFCKKHLQQPITSPPLSPFLAIARINDIIPSIPDIGLGLIAIDKIPAGEDLGNYAGIHYFSNTTSKYQLESGSFITPDGYTCDTGSIDAERFHNLTAFISDGIPNVFLKKRKETKECYFVSAVDILPGEFILWNYGSDHSVKHMPNYVDLSKEGFPLFLSYIPSYINDVKAMTREASSLRLLWYRLMFFFDTPRLFLQQVLTNQVDIVLLDDVFFSNARILRRKFGGKGFENNYVHSTITLCKIINTPEKKSVLWNHLQHIGEQNFNVAIKYIEKFSN